MASWKSRATTRWRAQARPDRIPIPPSITDLYNSHRCQILFRRSVPPRAPFDHQRPNCRTPNWFGAERTVVIPHLANREGPVAGHRCGPRPGQSPIWRHFAHMDRFRIADHTDKINNGAQNYRTHWRFLIPIRRALVQSDESPLCQHLAGCRWPVPGSAALLISEPQSSSGLPGYTDTVGSRDRTLGGRSEEFKRQAAARSE